MKIKTAIQLIFFLPLLFLETDSTFRHNFNREEVANFIPKAINDLINDIKCGCQCRLMRVMRCQEVIIREECTVLQEDICHEFLEPKCEKVPKRICRSSFVEDCKIDTKCETILDSNCRIEPRRECTDIQTECQTVLKSNCTSDSQDAQVCAEIPTQECKTQQQCGVINEQKCESIPRQHCTDVNVCTKTPTERCQNTYLNRCKKVPRRICNPVSKKSCRPVKKSVPMAFLERVCPTCQQREPTKIVTKVPRRKCYNQEQKPVCTPRYERECNDIPDENCANSQNAPEQKCMDIPHEVCEPITQQECRMQPVQECKKTDKSHCKPNKECTTKYEMKCKAVPGYDAPTYGYIQNNCGYTPLEECKNETKCQLQPKEECKVVNKEICSTVQMQKCQTHYRRECTPQPASSPCQQSTTKKVCKDVYKGEECEKPRSVRKCQTVEEEEVIIKPNRPLCLWPKIPKRIKCNNYKKH